MDNAVNLINPKSVKVFVDIDDTLTDLITPWLQMVNEIYGTDVKPEDVTSWSITAPFSKYIEKGVLTRDNIYDVLYSDELWDRVTPICGARKYMRCLTNIFDTYILSSTDTKYAKRKIDDMLLGYFKFLDKRKFILTSHKELIRGNILIDDNPSNLSGFVCNNPGSYGILFPSYHNREYEVPSFLKERIVRAHSWKDAFEYVCKFSYAITSANTENN